ncbi:XVIPCD domain-containing protein [Lysobacter silvisoli]|uniref:X-Tfes XVIPCD domain-containing protein n=1 Tax=Lysobacter silvisoli TaxID=2293254 RepID=A0A371JWD0_9GAMM|nr:XVIPCD domain-containing protein [Lysobacter silvisoli]RDZ25976.1 hypothetical protein DX914_19120 [Lysobacter silvisoli]
MTDHTYNPLERSTFEAIAYNAVGRASETNAYAVYQLSHSTGNSGWSVGAVQWDFGQTNRGHKVDELLAGYQAWAGADERFSDREIASLTTRLQTRGQTGNALTSEELSRLNGYLRSDPGRAFVDGLSQEQIQRKWDSVGQPLSQIPWLRDLSASDPAQAAEIVAMTSKLYNQNENRGSRLIDHLEAGAQSSDQIRDWIGSQGINGLKASAQSAIVSGRDNALAGVRLMNDLELGEGRLSQAWREQVHDRGNVSLSQDFNGNPDVQLLDAMMRAPASGARIFAHIDEGAQARAATITGIDANARLEMSRVSMDQRGQVTVVSPAGDMFSMTADGWSRNGVPMQAAPGVRREADRPDHMGRGGALGAQMDPVQPGAHPLLRQSQDAVQRLDASLGLPHTPASDCMSASVACLARSEGLGRVDHVMLSGATPTEAAGARVIAVEGDLMDPARRVAHMPTEVAVRTPVAESLQRLEQMERAQAQSVSPTQVAQQEVAPELHRRGLTM